MRAALRWALGRRRHRRLERLGDYFNAPPYATYAGWVGHGNLGDELMFAASRALLTPLQLIAARPRAPPELALLARLRGRSPLGDAFILGGGTLIATPNDGYLHDLRAAAAAGLPCFVFGTGDRDDAGWPQHLAPRRDAAWRRAVLSRALRVTVRGPQTADRLVALGLPRPEVVGDPALSACAPGSPRPAPVARALRVGLNLGGVDAAWGDPRGTFSLGLAVARALLARGVSLEFVPMNGADAHIGARLAAALRDRRFAVWRHHPDAARTVRRVATYDAMVGQRLHAAVIAMGSAVPTVALAYAPKCLDFMASFEADPWAVRADLATPADVLDRLDAALANRAALVVDLAARARDFQRRQRAEAAAILGALAHLTPPNRPWPR